MNHKIYNHNCEGYVCVGMLDWDIASYNFRIMYLQHGERWTGRDPCAECMCLQGQVECKANTCAKDLKCKPNHSPIKSPNACCPACVENDGVCRVRGVEDLSVTTFDALNFNFPAKCNYVLARDRNRKSFTIHLVNEYQTPFDQSASTVFTRSQNTSQLPPTKIPQLAVVVKIDGTKVRLSANNRVRVGRKRVRLPYVKLGVLAVRQEGETMELRATNGALQELQQLNLLSWLTQSCHSFIIISLNRNQSHMERARFGHHYAILIQVSNVRPVRQFQPESCWRHDYKAWPSRQR